MAYKTFKAQYYHKNPNSGSRASAQFSGSSSSIGGDTESAVIAHLRKKHLGKEITLMKLDWK